MSEFKLKIRKNKIDSILRRHPWVFSGALQEGQDLPPEDGTVVSLCAPDGKFLARGHFQHATISVRILSFEDIPIDQAFFDIKIQEAYETRKRLGLFNEQNSICRLIHGEGDQLPGLISDYYSGVVVVQCHSIGMYHSLHLISKSLRTVLGEEVRVYSKSSETLPKRTFGKDSFLTKPCTVPHFAFENGILYAIDWINGQKTGFFIDQRENRNLLAKYAKGKKVLNTFCYSGGFSLSALKGGAKLVHSLDSSKKAIELTVQNLQLNTFEGEHKSIVADAMEYIKELGEEYDIIVLDPPAFAKHRDKRHQAIQGYKRLNAHAIRQIRPGGIIFTFSCSQVVDKSLFTHTVISAAIETGRNVRILEQLHQPADHPINAFHPEGEYLKGLVIQVD
jgi:23S rRNA (cytosine1962-C5)-methyltransferase